jgi:hypothetical protein
MEFSSETVAIIVDPHFGPRLLPLAARKPVWIAATKGNALATKQVFRRQKRRNVGTATSFTVDPKLEPEDWCGRILAAVEEHHGPLSQEPPYRTLEVYGAEATAPLVDLLREFGFVRIQKTADGFLAERMS